jgi:hypothetical protein
MIAPMPARVLFLMTVLARAGTDVASQLTDAGSRCLHGPVRGPEIPPERL